MLDKLKNFLDYQYWFNFRKLDTYHRKLIDKKSLESIKSINKNWWDNKPLLDAFLNKLEYNIYHLRKSGIQSYSYINCFEDKVKNAEGETLEWIQLKVLEQLFGLNKNWPRASEENFNVKVFDKKRGFWKVKSYICNEEVDKSKSDNGAYSYYLNISYGEEFGNPPVEHNSYHDGFFNNKLLENLTLPRISVYITKVAATLIPPEKVPKSKRLYKLTIDENEGVSSELADSYEYKIVERIDLTRMVGLVRRSQFYNSEQSAEYFKNTMCLNLDRVVKTVLHRDDINIWKKLIMDLQTIDVKPSEYKTMPQELRSLIKGKRVLLTQMLEFRKLIKQLINMDIDTGKYWDMFESASKIKDGNERSEKLFSIKDLYLKDKKKLCRSIADAWAEFSDDWWD